VTSPPSCGASSCPSRLPRTRKPAAGLWPPSAVRTHTNAPCRTDARRGTLRPRETNAPGGPGRSSLSSASLGGAWAAHPVLWSHPGLLTQGGQGGRPAPLASRLHRIPTHFLLNLHGI
jgi:hypothetical protein